MSCSPARPATSTRSSRRCSAEQPPLPDHPEPRVRRHRRRAVTPGQAMAGRDLPGPGRHAAARPVDPGRPAAPQPAQRLHCPVPGRPPGVRGARIQGPGGHPQLRPGLSFATRRANNRWTRPGEPLAPRGWCLAAHWPCGAHRRRDASRTASLMDRSVARSVIGPRLPAPTRRAGPPNGSRRARTRPRRRGPRRRAAARWRLRRRRTRPTSARRRRGGRAAGRRACATPSARSRAPPPSRRNVGHCLAILGY